VGECKPLAGGRPIAPEHYARRRKSEGAGALEGRSSTSTVQWQQHCVGLDAISAESLRLLADAGDEDAIEALAIRGNEDDDDDDNGWAVPVDRTITRVENAYGFSA